MSPGNPKVDFRLAWARLGTPGRVAIVAAGLVLLTLAATLPAFVRALLAPSAETQASDETDAEKAKKYAEGFAGYLAQIDGRSLFLVPGPPKKPEVSAPPVVDDEPKEPEKPSSYGGPALVAMMNDTVWFDNGKRLTAGGEADGDVRVVALEAPWNARIEWKGVEFTVPLFAKDNLVIKTETKTPKDEPKDEPAPPPSDAESSHEKPAAEPKAAEPTIKPAKPDETPKPPPAPPEGGAPAAPGAAQPQATSKPAAPASTNTVQPTPAQGETKGHE